MLREYRTISGLIRVALGASLFLLMAGTLADADLWGHLRFGLDMLSTGRLTAVDPYSFTSDRPWINHEWLSELLMAIAYRGAGATGLNGLKLACIATIVTVVVAIARQHHATPAARDILVGLTVFATYTRTAAIRPQMFSVAVFCVVLYVLKEADRGRLRALWILPFCFAVWVNLHGGWILGLAVAGIWFAGAIVQQPPRRKTLLLVIAGVATLAATLVNPYGIGLWYFLAKTVGLGRADITEWNPLLALPPLILVFETILPMVAVATTRQAHWRPAWKDAAIVLLLVAAAFKVGRLDAFAQAALAILLAPGILTGLEAFGSKLHAQFWRARVPGGDWAAVGLVALALVVGGRRLTRIVVEGAWIPDKDAAMFLREHAHGARVLTWFDWGEYALWQLSPVGIRVSMDGRRETVYSSDVVRGHNGFYEAHAGDLDYAERIGADAVWLPVNAPVIAILRGRGSHVAFESTRSLVLTRAAKDSSRAATVPEERGIFPWP